MCTGISDVTSYTKIFTHLNLALLARQAWRVLRDPSALSARILKAAYFPNTDFLEARDSVGPSHIWRAHKFKQASKVR